MGVGSAGEGEFNEGTRGSADSRRRAPLPSSGSRKPGYSVCLLLGGPLILDAGVVAQGHNGPVQARLKWSLLVEVLTLRLIELSHEFAKSFVHHGSPQKSGLLATGMSNKCWLFSAHT